MNTILKSSLSLALFALLVLPAHATKELFMEDLKWAEAKFLNENIRLLLPGHPEKFGETYEKYFKTYYTWSSGTVPVSSLELRIYPIKIPPEYLNKLVVEITIDKSTGGQSKKRELSIFASPPITMYVTSMDSSHVYKKHPDQRERRFHEDDLIFEKALDGIRFKDKTGAWVRPEIIRLPERVIERQNSQEKIW